MTTLNPKQKSSDALLNALDSAIDSLAKPETTSAAFASTLETPGDGNPAKRIHWPQEILSPHVDARIRGGRWTPVGAGTLRAILGDEDLADAGTLQKLKSLQAQYVELAAKQSVFTLQAANKTFDGQRQKMHDDVASGNIPTTDDSTLRTREDIQADFRAKHNAIGQVLNKLSRQAAELARPVLERAADTVYQSMEQTEQAERDAAKKYDLAWAPSPIFKAHASVLAGLRKRIDALNHFLKGSQGYSHCEPKFFLENIVNL